MSGGSYEYKYLEMERYYVGKMFDNELNAMMEDLVSLLHDLEWWQSGDIGDEGYQKTVKEFKDTWFGEKRRGSS